MAPNHNFIDPERIEHGSPLRLPGHPVNGQPMDLEGWSGIQTEVHILASVAPTVVVSLLVLHASWSWIESTICTGTGILRIYILSMLFILPWIYH